MTLVDCADSGQPIGSICVNLQEYATDEKVLVPLVNALPELDSVDMSMQPLAPTIEGMMGPSSGGADFVHAQSEVAHS